jgi:hypothetical protein
MLKAQSLVVLSKHVRSLLIHEDHVVRCRSANTNEESVPSVRADVDEAVYVPQDVPTLNALSSGHGSGF